MKELTRTIAGYKRTITDLEKRLAEAEARQQCTRRHLDEEDDNASLLEKADMKEQLSGYESELAILRRRDSERESLSGDLSGLKGARYQEAKTIRDYDRLFRESDVFDPHAMTKGFLAALLKKNTSFLI